MELNQLEFEQIRNILGTPYYEEERVLLYNMDSIEALIMINNNNLQPFDLTVTSPPYNIGKAYEKIMPVDQYVQWTKKWIQTVYNTTRESGSLWLNVGYMPVKGIGKAIPLTYLIWDKTEFYMIQELVWHYGAGVASKKSLSPRNEKVIWYVKDQSNYIFNLDSIRNPNVKYPNQKKNGKLRVNPLGKNPSDVWDIPKVTSGKNRSSKERVNHPAQTPTELFKRIVLAGSNNYDIVLDPFIGSGTTAVVTKKLNRYVVGFDINKEYLDMAVSRLKTEIISDKSVFVD